MEEPSFDNMEPQVEVYPIIEEEQEEEKSQNTTIVEPELSSDSERFVRNS